VRVCSSTEVSTFRHRRLSCLMGAGLTNFRSPVAIAIYDSYRPHAVLRLWRNKGLLPAAHVTRERDSREITCMRSRRGGFHQGPRLRGCVLLSLASRGVLFYYHIRSFLFNPIRSFS
jgi:hypothetical protein